MMDFKDFDLEHWWNVLAAAGFLITIAAITAGSRSAVLIGLGILALGIGESMQRTRRNEMRYPEPGVPAMLGTGFRRQWSAVGSAVQICGAAVAAFGVYRLLAS